MKKVILAAALCSTAVALAGAANADETSDFLSGSTNALILGPTGISTPAAGYIGTVEKLFLEPNGYDGTTASTLPLTTPETYDFLPSVTQGQTALVNAVVADYNAGDMHCTVSGLCSDPLTIFTYSQSSAVADLAENQLAADKIPTDALRFVMLGDNPIGTPDNLYPSEVYNINGDFWAQPGASGITLQDIWLGMELHEAYLGLTPAEIASAAPVVEGLTTYFDIPTLTSTELWDAMINVFSAGLI